MSRLIEAIISHITPRHSLQTISEKNDEVAPSTGKVLQELVALVEKIYAEIETLKTSELESKEIMPSVGVEIETPKASASQGEDMTGYPEGENPVDNVRLPGKRFFAAVDPATQEIVYDALSAVADKPDLDREINSPARGHVAFDGMPPAGISNVGADISLQTAPVAAQNVGEVSQDSLLRGTGQPTRILPETHFMVNGSQNMENAKEGAPSMGSTDPMFDFAARLEDISRGENGRAQRAIAMAAAWSSPPAEAEASEGIFNNTGALLMRGARLMDENIPDTNGGRKDLLTNMNTENVIGGPGRREGSSGFREFDFMNFGKTDYFGNALSKGLHSADEPSGSLFHSLILDKIEKVVEQQMSRGASMDMVVRLKLDENETLLVGFKNEGNRVIVEIKTPNESIMNLLQLNKDTIARNLETKNVFTNIYINPDGEGGSEKREGKREGRKDNGGRKANKKFIEFLGIPA